MKLTRSERIEQVLTRYHNSGILTDKARTRKEAFQYGLIRSDRTEMHSFAKFLKEQEGLEDA